MTPKDGFFLDIRGFAMICLEKQETATINLTLTKHNKGQNPVEVTNVACFYDIMACEQYSVFCIIKLYNCSFFHKRVRR